MDRPTCATCPYWDSDLFDGDAGFCRRLPPSLSPHLAKILNDEANPDDDARGVDDGFWPITDHDAWCGKHPEMRDWITANRPATASTLLH